MLPCQHWLFGSLFSYRLSALTNNGPWATQAARPRPCNYNVRLFRRSSILELSPDTNKRRCPSIAAKVRLPPFFIQSVIMPLQLGLSVSPPKESASSCRTFRRHTIVIQNFEEFWHESNVTAPSNNVPRLVDNPMYASDIRLWTQLLHFRVRIEGIKGALKIWRGMRHRNVNLPTFGREADELWGSVISAALRTYSADHRILHELWKYALGLTKQTHRYYEALYEQVLSFFLRTCPKEALAWHQRLRKIELPAPGTLSRLFDNALGSKEAIKAFRQIYGDLPTHNLYDKVITSLCDCGDYREAMQWHSYLMSKGDLPTTAAVTDPLRHHLALHGEQKFLETMTNDLVNAGVSFAGSTSKHFNTNVKISREIMNRMLGETHGVTPKVISDHFCARVFATKAFSIHLIISGLAALGHEALGPLALRELAVRCSTPEEITSYIHQMGDLGISVTSCVYSELIQKLARDHRTELLDAVLSSDQHPDVFEDRPIQEKLLKSYIAIKDWPQVHRTLMILTMFYKNPSEEAWNVILRSYMKEKNWKMISQVFEDMLLNRVAISRTSVRRSFFCLLRPRRPAKRPVSVPEHFDDLSFVTNMWLRILHSGGEIQPIAWNQVHNYFGMEGRLEELESVSIWLALFYSRRLAQSAASKLMPFAENPVGLKRPSVLAAQFLLDSNPQTSLRQIFTVQRQSAIVQWGFKTLGMSMSKAGERSTLDINSVSAPNMAVRRSESWARGLALCKYLRQCGVQIHTSTVRKACLLRLLILFGPRRSNKPENRLAKERNPYTLNYMLRYLNDMWGGRLFNLPMSVSRVEGTIAQQILRKTILGPGANETWHSRTIPTIHYIAVHRCSRLGLRSHQIYSL